MKEVDSPVEQLNSLATNKTKAEAEKPRLYLTFLKKLDHFLFGDFRKDEKREFVEKEINV